LMDIITAPKKTYIEHLRGEGLLRHFIEVRLLGKKRRGRKQITFTSL